jgi:hypothetical protein
MSSQQNSYTVNTEASISRNRYDDNGGGNKKESDDNTNRDLFLGVCDDGVSLKK